MDILAARPIYGSCDRFMDRVERVRRGYRHCDRTVLKSTNDLYLPQVHGPPPSVVSHGHGHGHGHGLHSPSLVSRHHTQSPAVQHNHAHSHLTVHRRETRGKQLNANLSLSERKRAVTVHVCCMFDHGAAAAPSPSCCTTKRVRHLPVYSQPTHAVACSSSGATSSGGSSSGATSSGASSTTTGRGQR